jgi:uncharacterized protein with FMN-binding domain
MRRALAALVVTAAAVWLLAGYDTHPPRRPPPPAAKPPAIERRAPGTRTARGPLISTPFSSIQVEATLTRGRLSGVRTLSLTGSDTHTQALNARAEPILRREALRARSAEIDVVTGATYTSESWIESLQAAIEAARHGG